jgi:hypothetical protein
LRRPHKRKRATCLKGKCVEYIGDNLHAVFEAGVLDIKLRVQILEYLCENPVLVELPDGGWLPRRARARAYARAQVPREHADARRRNGWGRRPWSKRVRSVAQNHSLTIACACARVIACTENLPAPGPRFEFATIASVALLPPLFTD